MTINEYIKQYDPTNQFQVLKESYKQAEYALKQEINIKLENGIINSVIVSGMGGSAISADILRNFLRDEIRLPYFVNRSYRLPAFADEKTLLIISSYSGGTEESLAVLKEGIERKCKIVCITTGGEVKNLAEKNKLPYLVLSPGMQPRYSLGQSFFMLLRLLEYLKIIPGQGDIITRICDLWRERGQEYSSANNQALQYAEMLIGFTPVIYSAVDLTDAAGYRFKCQLNENSKIHAFHNIIPEMNHNEIIGWESFFQKDFRAKVINFLDKEYSDQVIKRFRISSALITAKETEIINLESSQNNFKLRLFDLIYLTDWISYYLAVLRGFDPVEIENINILKKQLA